jgi:hypothetical protein
VSRRAAGSVPKLLSVADSATQYGTPPSPLARQPGTAIHNKMTSLPGLVEGPGRGGAVVGPANSGW